MGPHLSSDCIDVQADLDPASGWFSPASLARGFLLTSNPSLNKLREMILSLSQKDMDSTNTAPFPAFPSQEDVTNHVRKPAERNVKLLQERLQTAACKESVEDLPPFPVLCRHFQRRAQETEINKANRNLIGSAANTVQDKLHSCKQKVINSDELCASKAKTQTEKRYGCDNNLDMKNTFLSSTDDIGDENGTVIRDRNSNFYALQSHNISIRNTSQLSEPRVLNAGTNERKNIISKAVEKHDFSSSCVSNSQTSNRNTVTHLPSASSFKHGVETKREGTLQRCPLCQIEFDSSFNQMDINSHIATCLSTSEDDIMW